MTPKRKSLFGLATAVLWVCALSAGIAGPDDQAAANARVGNVYWISAGGAQLCQSLTVSHDDFYNCPRIAQGKIRIISVLWAPLHSKQNFDFYKVEYIPTGKLGYIRVDHSHLYLVTYDPQARARAAADECARRGQPRIGMARAEAEATCWGRPMSINRTITASGTTVQAVYSRNRYIYYTDDRVTAIQDTGH